MGQNQPTQPYPGYQQNLAARQGYPGYQSSFDTLAPVLPEIQPASYPGYNQQPIAPIILPEPQPPQPRRTGRIALIVFLALLLIAASAGGFIFYTNHQNTVHAQATVTSQAHARASATARVQATARAIASVYPFSHQLLLNDPLSGPDHVAQYGWLDNTPSCFFANQAYNVFASQVNTTAICSAQQLYFYNFTFQVQMTIQQGSANARGGLVFRSQASTSECYLLTVDAQGNYQLMVSLDPNLVSGRVLQSGQISAFLPGLNQKNTLAVVARGTHIIFYANQKLITQVTDNTYSGGQLGLVSHYSNTPTIVAYTNARVWQF